MNNGTKSKCCEATETGKFPLKLCGDPSVKVVALSVINYGGYTFDCYPPGDYYKGARYLKSSSIVMMAVILYV